MEVLEMKRLILVMVLMVVLGAPCWADIHGEFSAQYNDFTTQASVLPFWAPGATEYDLYNWSADVWWATRDDKWRIGANLIYTADEITTDLLTRYYQIYVSYRPLAWLELTLANENQHNFAPAIKPNQWGEVSTYRDMYGYSFKVAVTF
jgi:hypothetical protein